MFRTLLTDNPMAEAAPDFQQAIIKATRGCASATR